MLILIKLTHAYSRRFHNPQIVVHVDRVQTEDTLAKQSFQDRRTRASGRSLHNDASASVGGESHRVGEIQVHGDQATPLSATRVVYGLI